MATVASIATWRRNLYSISYSACLRRCLVYWRPSCRESSSHLAMLDSMGFSTSIRPRTPRITPFDVFPMNLHGAPGAFRFSELRSARWARGQLVRAVCSRSRLEFNCFLLSSNRRAKSHCLSHFTFFCDNKETLVQHIVECVWICGPFGQNTSARRT
jgi:hypothetical protein